MSRTILAVVDDMFFASKIRATAEALGIDISFARNKDILLEKARAKKPDLILVDLHNSRFDPLDVAQTLKGDSDLNTVELLGFFSHVEVDLQKRAVAAGYDYVIPRSVFSRDLAQILASDRAV